jgi:hypothetical protein
VKPPVCRRCGEGFIPRSTLQALCSPKCLLAEVKAKEQAERADRVLTRERLDALKPHSHWVKLAQRAFNRYIRARDTAAGLPCISCDDALLGGRKFSQGQYDAGHYLTTGARPELRFHEDNCHRQCKQCNQHLHGNLVLYRVGLIARIGEARVAALEGPHPPAKWSIDQLKALQRVYAAKARAIEKPLLDAMERAG